MVHGRADPERDGVADYVRHLTAALGDRGVEVVGIGVGGLLDTARRIRAARPDVVHVQFAPSAFGFCPRPGLLPDLIRGTAPLVTTLHEYGWWSAPAWMPEWVWRACERRRLLDRETWRLAPASAVAVTTNAGHADTLNRRLGMAAIRVPLAPNVPDGGPVERVTVRDRLGVPRDARVVTFFGFVHPVKGLRYLIEAVAMLRRDGRPVHLLVLGGFTSLALPEDEATAFRAELADRARDAGVDRHVTITGHLPAAEVSAALHSSDIAAFPFTAGATTKSGALLSAFAHRLPTLVTAAEPPDPELVDGETVVVARRVRDVDVLVNGLRRLLDDDAMRERVARGGAGLCTDRTWERIAAAHCDLYDDLCDDLRDGVLRAA